MSSDPSPAPEASARLMAIDWGTTNARVYLLDETGTPIAVRRQATGVRNLTTDLFPAAFAGLLGEWLDQFADLPIILAGMVGSREGWVEAPYVRCPATMAEIAAACSPLEVAPGRRGTIVPGLSCVSETGAFDVMRGEEIQIFGAAAADDDNDNDDNAGRRLVILPGTHGKWALVGDGQVQRFHTTMTGEVFDVLSHQSMLGRAMPDHHAPDDAAFARGLARARDPGGLLHHIFSVRAQALSGDEVGSGLPSYLSGILVGHEVAGMARLFDGLDTAILVGAPGMCDLYARALGGIGVMSTTLNGDVAASRGLWALSALAGIR